MGDTITVTCPKCGKTLRCPASAAGKTGKCAGCGEVIEIPLTMADAGGDANDDRPCPFCAETILAAAIKCKHCGSSLASSATGRQKDETLGLIMVLVPLLGTLLCYFWIGSMTLMDGPAKWLFAIGMLVSLSTAGLCAYEGKRIGLGKEGPDRKRFLDKQTPAAWFVFVAFLWIVGFPLYLYQRSRYGLRNLLIPGAIVALLFVLSAWSMHNSIENARERLRIQLPWRP